MSRANELVDAYAKAFRADHDCACAKCNRPLTSSRRALDEHLSKLEEKAALLDAPEIIDFVKAVQLEAAHQRARWPSEHDAGKSDADWFWLIGYLAGKALGTTAGDAEKQLHRIITIAAAACNWHAAKLGLTNMRPGIDTPLEAQAASGES